MNVPNMNKQITFVDSDLQDYQSLIQNADTAEVVILNDTLSAIEQITPALIEDIAIVGTTKKAIAFIDPTVEDYQMLVAGVVPGIQAVVLDPKRDGVEQITQVLGNSNFVEAVHIISHGSPGSLHLGNTQLSLETLNRYATRLQQWEAPHILLYGCNVATGDAGEELISKLHQLTGATVYAAKTLVGASERGGTWNLSEVAGTSHLKASSLAFSPEVLAQYPAVLPFQTINPTGGTNSTDGIKVEIYDNGIFQVYRNNAGQVFGSGSPSGFLGLGVGSTTYGTNAGDQQLTLLTQSAVSGVGTSANPYQVGTTLYADVNSNNTYDSATDFQIQWVTSYAAPQALFSQVFNITAPAGNTSPVKLYQGFDTFLAGGDAGPAYGLTAAETELTGTTDNPKFIGVRKDAGLPSESFMGFLENQGEFSRWYSGLFYIPFNEVISGGDITNTYDTDPSTDNGIAVQYDLGAITGATTISNSLGFTLNAVVADTTAPIAPTFTTPAGTTADSTPT
ncbi:DUF4347 domain-containing protein, partial [Microcoleus sp. BROC3]|uniref:DUF4347 domain-containing protein n=1 Tax=Microcoleus sp. BROC3 TaxID=3055323 RepID=UPI002FD15B64